MTAIAIIGAMDEEVANIATALSNVIAERIIC